MGMTDREREERYMLSVAALRFDGLKYCDDHEEFADKLLKLMFEYVETNRWSELEPLEQYTAFHMLQRNVRRLAKEGSTEPLAGKIWAAYRHLFLMTRPHAIPKQYRDKHYDKIWQKAYAHRKEECVAWVQETLGSV